MFNILIFFLVGLISGTESLDNNITVPDCVVNYTTFINSYADNKKVTLISNYSGISGVACGTKCDNNSNCTSFNFFPSDIFSLNSLSKCELISTKFNSSFLIDKNNVSYFLKSSNDCSSQNIYKWEIIILLCALGVFIVCFGCYCCCKDKKRVGYDQV